jgi:hypothetical protein
VQLNATKAVLALIVAIKLRGETFAREHRGLSAVSYLVGGALALMSDCRLTGD